MGRITTGQSHQVMATLAINTNWEEIDFELADLQERIIRKPKEVGAQFAAFLKNGGRVIMNVKEFRVWKTVKVGTHKDAKALKQAIQENGLRVSDYAADIMAKSELTLSAEESTLDLVNVSAADFNFTGRTPLRYIFARAFDFGLSLCPAEVGPQLRLQYLDQPNDEWLSIAMEPIADSDNGRDIFLVTHEDDGRWLRTDSGDPINLWNPEDRFLFVLRK